MTAILEKPKLPGSCALAMALFLARSLASAAPVPVVANGAVSNAVVSARWTTNSPVQFFRQLLAMSPAERNQALSNRTALSRTLLLAKVREYQRMPPQVREQKLRITEVRWHLQKLMAVAATNRLAQLAQVPAAERPVVTDRLEEWDKLTPTEQKEMLVNEAAISSFAAMGGRKSMPFEVVSATQRERFEAGVRNVHNMTDAERAKVIAQFRQFLDLEPEQQDKILAVLPEAERAEVGGILRAFGKLSRIQRSLCIRSFEQFARMEEEERMRFLENAERWKIMTEAERQSWREVASKQQ